ncbi:hypothetical protein PPERSA_00256 [Pseudocohnilembus persalinus]|uniref:Uncharacterized protein n=1 Tax=Pseudocohnilembus persalinus TaxID=266149 RepID=A0A0V0Q8V4_PSEPJ|nr:hypothetical protein PPERSA_00256 [Pseudocohnilembus persalinus]|eukprot:KRW98668.1 hypothetical protein PPERSA_00256 [Pseudocohnilembus persalinus]
MKQYPFEMCCKPIQKDERQNNDQLGSHEGHRVFYYHKISNEATCDCGDTEQPWPLLCKKHTGKKLFTREQILNSFIPSQELINDLDDLLHSQFKIIFEMFDTRQNQLLQDGQISQRINQIVLFIEQLIKDNMPITYLMGEILNKPIQNYYSKHDCKQLENINMNFSNQMESLLGETLGNKIEVKIADLFKKTMINDHFKYWLVDNFGTCYNFLIYQSSAESGYYGLYAQFFSFQALRHIYQHKLFLKYSSDNYKSILYKVFQQQGEDVTNQCGKNNVEPQLFIPFWFISGIRSVGLLLITLIEKLGIQKAQNVLNIAYGQTKEFIIDGIVCVISQSLVFSHVMSQCTKNDIYSNLQGNYFQIIQSKTIIIIQIKLRSLVQPRKTFSLGLQNQTQFV